MHVAGEQGDYIVRGAQPLGVLAVILLEPLCDDGLTAWNYFDAALDPLMKAPRSYVSRSRASRRRSPSRPASFRN